MATRSTDAPAPPIESHDIHYRRLLAHAAEMIAQGDRLQASEKLWGATAHRLKAFAAGRGWPYLSHADGRVIVRHIASHAGNPQIGSLFKVALDAHRNYYDDGWDHDDLIVALREIRTLVDLLNAAEGALRPDLEPPTARHYRRRHGLAPASERD